MTCRQLDASDTAALTALLAAEPMVANYASHAGDVLHDVRYEVWGHYADDVLAGAVIIALGPFDAEVDSIIVADACRRRGLGQKLMTRAVVRAQTLGKERVLLEVRECNAAAIALYQQLGFSIDGMRANYYAPLERQGPREAACLMSLSLG